MKNCETYSRETRKPVAENKKFAESAVRKIKNPVQRKSLLKTDLQSRLRLPVAV